MGTSKGTPQAYADYSTLATPPSGNRPDGYRGADDVSYLKSLVFTSMLSMAGPARKYL
jgi:hypothetical protein